MAQFSFDTLLASLDGGSVVEEATHQLRAVVRAARIAGKKGKLVVTIDVEPDGKQFVVNAKVDAKLPIPAPGQTMFFANEDGELVRDNPRQEQLRGTERPAGALRPVSHFDGPQKGA